VCGRCGGRRREADGRRTAGYRTKNKNPTQRCGEKGQKSKERNKTQKRKLTDQRRQRKKRKRKDDDEDEDEDQEPSDTPGGRKLKKQPPNQAA